MHLSGLLSSLDVSGLLSNTASGGSHRHQTAPVLLKQPNTRLRPEQITQLIADYQAGVHLRELAKNYKISESTVKRHIRASGVPHRTTWALTAEQVREATHLYVEERWSILRLSKHLGCAEETVRNALRKNGVTLRTRGRPKSGG